MHDGDAGCEPVLPEEPCPVGQLAIPGESACHVVMPCGAGTWGDIPVDTTTVYVNASYAGMDSDGSSTKPFTTVSDAVAAAASNSLIAIAGGSYVEDVDVAGKAVRLWGKCPGEVELLGTGAALAALVIREGASGTEVHGLAFGGSAIGLGISGAEHVMVDRVWVHGTLQRGIDAETTLGATSITLRDSLVEDNHDIGVLVMGADATVEGTVVRRTLPRVSDQLVGRGVSVEVLCSPGGCTLSERSTTVLRRSLVEDNHDLGVYVAGSDVTLEDMVVRRTLPNASDQSTGRGIGIQFPCVPPDLCYPEARSTALVRGSLIEENHDIGVFVSDSDVTLEGTVVRSTQPLPLEQYGGRGLAILPGCVEACFPGTRSNAVVRSSLVEDNHDIGVFVMGSDATLEGLLVRRTLPNPSDASYGRGIIVQVSCFAGVCDPTARATALVRGSRAEENYGFGVGVGSADATLEGVLVQSTLAEPGSGFFGDGISVFSYVAPASATVTATRVEANPRAGLSNFGATVALGANALACNGFDLAGDELSGQPFRFETLADNACGCPDPIDGCKAQTADLEPPTPITSQ